MGEIKMIPVPTGMSDGFYQFMGAGAQRSADGTILMLAEKLGVPKEILEGNASYSSNSTFFWRQQ